MTHHRIQQCAWATKFVSGPLCPEVINFTPLRRDFVALKIAEARVCVSVLMGVQVYGRSCVCMRVCVGVLGVFEMRVSGVNGYLPAKWNR